MDKKIYILALVMLICLSLSAQINVKVGYEYDRISNDAIQQIINSYNADNPFLDTPLNQVKNHSGLAIGVRYKYDQFGIEVFGSRTTGDSKAVGDQSMPNFEYKLGSTVIGYGLGIQQSFGIVGLGASVGRQSIKYKSKVNNSDREKTIFNEIAEFARFNLSFEFKSEKITLALKPFIQFTLGSYNLDALRDELAPTLNLEDSNIKPKTWGITLVFYNGPQGK